MMSSRPPATPREWLYRLVPAIGSLRGYTFGAARADVLAGLSVAAVAVPQAMAYAMIVGLPPQIGLYTAIVMTAVGAVFDSSRQLINGPTNAISIALLGTIGAAATMPEKIEVAILMAFLVGVIQIGITLLRLGDLTKYISHSVIVGFTMGASVLLVLDQTKNLLGLRAMGDVHDHFLSRFWQSMTGGGAVHLPTLAVGGGALLLVVLLRWLKRLLKVPLFPELLVVTVAAAAVTAWLGLDRQGVRVIGEIPALLPRPHLPSLDAERVRTMASSALAVALLGLLEAISMAKSIAAVTRQKLDLNQQCLSEGCANVAGSFFSCMPGSGSLTRSAVNQQAGAQTQWSGVISAGAVALTMMVFAPYAQYIPRSALAGVLILTAARMVNLRDVRYHMRVSRFDAVIVAATAISAVAVSIEFCVLIGVVLSFLLAVPRAGNMLLTEFVVTPEGGIHERLEQDQPCGHMLMFGLEGEMFFGSVTSLEAHLDNIESRVGPDTKVVLMRMKRSRNPDAAGMAIFEGFMARMKERGVRVILCGVRKTMQLTFEKSGLAAKLDDQQVFLEQPIRTTSTLLAIQHACTLLEEGCPRCPPRDFKKEMFYAT